MADAKMSWSHTADNEKLIKLQHKWTIDGYSYRTQRLTSSTFCDSEQADEKWCIIADPMGDIGADGYLSLFIYRVSNVTAAFTVTFTFSLFNSQNKALKMEGEFSVTFSKKNQTWGRKKFILRADLMKDLREDDKLIIVCDLSYKVITSTEAKGGSEPPLDFELPKCKFHENLGHLLDTEYLSDVILTVGSVQLKAHKTILAAQSLVFAAMFKHEDFVESKKNLVKIEDIEPDVVKEMLRFMYTGETPNLSTMAEALLAAADKYALDRLKIMCEKSLYECLTVETAVNTLYVADLHNANKLKRHAIDYICANPNVIETGEWKKRKLDASLMEEVFKGFYKKAGTMNSK